MKKQDLKPSFKKRKLKMVLCLCGEEKVGKSETLTAVARSLAETSLFYYVQKGQNDSHDRRISLKYNGRIIGICTAGDTPEIIRLNFRFLRYEGCEIGIMAVRDSVKLNMNKIKGFQKRNQQVRFVFVNKKDYTSSYAQILANAAYVDLVQSALNLKGFKKIYNQIKVGMEV